MGNGLEHLLAEGVISEVVARLQAGKEAEVFAVRFGDRVVAAKVYKDSAQRSFKHNALYKEGRGVRSSRSRRAIDRGSRFGKASAEDAWKSAEADALYRLHAADVRVPTPVLYLDGVLLMELVLDADGNAARRLIDTHLTVGQANAAYHDMVAQLVRILACDLIHGDLSPYNVLWAAAGPTIIDFPQIVSAAHNSSSERFFLRDADNILGHLARIDRSLLGRRGDGWEIWQAYRNRELTPDFRPCGRGRPVVAMARPFTPAAPQDHRQARQGPGRSDRRAPQAQGQGPRPVTQTTTQGSRRGPQGATGGARRAVRLPEVIVRRSPMPPPPEQARQAASPATTGTGEQVTPGDGGTACAPRRRRRRRR
jgi:RIO kinase 1